MNSKIKILKDKHEKEMMNYNRQIDEFLANKSNTLNCDYLRHRLQMSNYHRGAYNVLIELEKSI